jgi:3-hydroxyacyl-CoA dehydrogenase
MSYEINKVAVLGAGVMGATIAGHLANAGIPSVLLDIVPRFTEQDAAAGLTEDSPAFRNRLAVKGIQGLKKAKPAPLFLPELVELITPGNFEDHLEWLRDVDWVIEVIIERMDIKRSLLARVAEHVGPRTIVTTNTSGLSINAMAEGLPADLRKRFLGTHFFNPPRYMKLLEIIPGEETDPEVVRTMVDFGEKVLGKGIVYAKDTPNFVGNRIGVFALMHVIHTMVEMGLTIDEVDLLTGKVIGHPNSASFRTADLVGLDTFLHVANNVYESLTEDERRETFRPPEFMARMVENGWLGVKSGAGFYKKTKVDGKTQILTLDYRTLEYHPQEKPSFASVTAAQNARGTAARIRALIEGKDKGAEFTWRTFAALVDYGARRIPEIADDIVNIDNAMKWGFGWKLGPFEKADAVGVPYFARRWAEEGHEVPPLIAEMLEAGQESFYERREGRVYYWDVGKKEMVPVPMRPEQIEIPMLKARSGGIIKENSDASLIDMGDGVALLEFHTKMNAQGPTIWNLMNWAVDEVERNWEGLVIGNQGSHFSAGANLMLMLMAIQEEEWDEVDAMIRLFQKVNMRLKYSSKPVVGAPHGMVLGGGTEVCLHCDQLQVAGETYMGLVELGVGLIPAGGGTKEMTLRAADHIPKGVEAELLPFIRRAFETIGMAKVSMGAPEAARLGFLRPTDKITMNKDFLLHDAKQALLGLAKGGYKPGKPRTDIRVLGRAGLAAIEVFLWNMKEGNFISEYDMHLGRKLAHIMCGGEVEPGTLVSEQYLLDLEREVFLGLMTQAKTAARIQHMLRTGKPLRN